jgi:hypothetical protein
MRLGVFVISCFRDGILDFRKSRAQASSRAALWSCKTRAILVFIARNRRCWLVAAEVKSEQAAMLTPMSIFTMAPTLPQ